MTRYRLIYAGLGLTLVALVAATWALSPDGDGRRLPAVLELVVPTPNSTALRQTSIVVDMVPGYAVELVVDGVAIAPSELSGSPALGRYEWAPGVGKTLQEWTPGAHSVEVSWNTATGLPDIGVFSWEFRIQ
jgi:hypothetical protein